MKPAKVLLAVLLVSDLLVCFSGCAEQAAEKSPFGQQPAGGARGGRPGGRDFNGMRPDWNSPDFNGRPPGGMDENRFLDMIRQRLGLPAEAAVSDIKQALGLPETASVEEVRQSFFEKFGGDFNMERRVYNE
ncbi:MAG: hypothetical protein V1493_02655 [Candidatus Diapherotrites archaeon]